MATTSAARREKHQYEENMLQGSSVNTTGSVTPSMLHLPMPYLLFLGESVERGYAKTAIGLKDWAPEKCIGEYALAGASVSTGLERMSPAEARTRGAKTMIVGSANPGGTIPQSWIGALVEAAEAGLNIAAGMHVRLSSFSALAEAAERNNVQLIDVRVPPASIPVGTGRKRSGRRLLTVGTDCALGKKYTALAIAKGLSARGLSAQFRASGQTGIMIAGAGMPMDAVVADFLAGAAELLSPDAAPDHIDVIEGQGSLFHPAYAGVTLGLLHGSQPDGFVVCHEPGRAHVLGYPGFPLPSIAAVIDLTVALGRLTNPKIRCVGISLNTSSLTEPQAHDAIKRAIDEVGLPAADPVRGGAHFERLLDACAI